MKTLLFFVLICANVLFSFCQDDFPDTDNDNMAYTNAEAPQDDDETYEANGGNDRNDDGTMTDDVTLKDDNYDDTLKDDYDGENNEELLQNDDDNLRDDDDYDANELQGDGNDNDFDSEKFNDKTFEEEFHQADPEDVLGSNLHQYVPQTYAYSDLGRRFVPVYSYFEKKDREVKQQNFRDDSQDPVPQRAPPEVVLAMAQQAKLLQKSKPRDSDRLDEQKNILRSGDYWNSVWKEDADPDPKPKTVLRSPQFTTKENKLSKLQAKVYPGSKLYSLLSKLNDNAPELLYLINVHDGK